MKKEDGSFEMIEQSRPEEIEEDTGMCPFPSQKVLNTYIENYTKMISTAQEKNVLHTDDRYDLKALFT